jgi:ligand-binding sensor domain-containing protein/signal transduction histidine kinase
MLMAPLDQNKFFENAASKNGFSNCLNSRAVCGGMCLVFLGMRHIAFGRLLLLGIGAGLPAFADPAPISNAPPFLIRSWQTEQGLPHNSVGAITQTHDGYFWVGTDAGLARFDGVRCRVFGLQDGLGVPQIAALLEDRHGVLWVGTAGGGLSRYDHGKFQTFTVKDGLAGDSISALLEGFNDDLWVGTFTGVSRWRNGQFEPASDGLDSTFVFELAKDRQGNVWAATLHNGLMRFRDGKFAVVNGPEGVTNIDPRCLLVDNKDRLWVGSRDKFILSCEDGKWTSYGANEGLPEVVFNRLAQTRDGVVWAGSLDEGLYYCQSNRFKALRKQEGLPDDAILALFTDGEGFLWAGTESGGLSRIGPKRISVYHPMEGPSECRLRSLVQTTNGALWVGTYGQGLFRWQGDHFEQLLQGKLGGHMLLEAVLAARDGSLWWGAGPAMIQWRDGRVLSSLSDTPWTRNDRIWSLCEDRGGGLWVGTYNGKVGLLRQKKFTPLQGVSAKPVTALVQEPDGTLWIGTLGGGLIRRQDEKLAFFTVTNGLRSNLVRALLLDSQGSLWIGTDGGGLSRRTRGQWANFTTRHGLLDDTILQILEDDDGSLWLGCNRGLCRVSTAALNEVAEARSAELHPLVFGSSEGMPSEECVGNFAAALKTSDGRLCFSTAKGIVVIDPRSVTNNSPSPAVLLEDILVDNQLNPMLGKIAPGRHSLEFHYTGLSFEAPEKIRFRYRLEGLDTDWVNAGEGRVARYPYVPPGPYRFAVTACDSAGQWSRSAAEVAFFVQPQYWQTNWFRVAAGLLLLGGIGGGIRRVERRRYKARLRRLEQEQAMERERARIARDLHDELGSSLSYISMLSDLGQSRDNSVDQFRKRVEKISNFSIRTARALDEIVWAVNPRNDSLRSLLLYLTQYARELFEDTGMSCRFQIPDDLPQVSLLPDMRHDVFLTVKEALNNALKHSRATEIFLRAEIVGQQMELLVQDNGAGFDLAAVQSRSVRNGLTNMRQRVEGLGGQFQVETTPGQGATIRLKVHWQAGPAVQSRNGGTV